MTPQSGTNGLTFGGVGEDRMGPFAASTARRTFDTDEDLPPCSMRQVDRRVGTAGQSIDRTSNGTDRLAPASSTEHRPIAQSATGTSTADPAHTAGLAARRNTGTHAFAYLPFVPGGTIRLDSAPAAPLAGDPAVLPDQRLHQHPGAASRGRHRELPRLRLLPEDRLTAPAA